MNAAGAESPVPAVTLDTVEQLRDRIRRTSKLKGRQADEKSLDSRSAR
jgi:formate dehydrogenase